MTHFIITLDTILIVIAYYYVTIYQKMWKVVKRLKKFKIPVLIEYIITLTATLFLKTWPLISVLYEILYFVTIFYTCMLQKSLFQWLFRRTHGLRVRNDAKILNVDHCLISVSKVYLIHFQIFWHTNPKRFTIRNLI